MILPVTSDRQMMGKPAAAATRCVLLVMLDIATLQVQDCFCSDSCTLCKPADSAQQRSAAYIQSVGHRLVLQSTAEMHSVSLHIL